MNEALEASWGDHAYFVMEHSGHGLQNDDKTYAAYMRAVEDYLNQYMPVSK